MLELGPATATVARTTLFPKDLLCPKKTYSIPRAFKIITFPPPTTHSFLFVSKHSLFFTNDFQIEVVTAVHSRQAVTGPHLPSSILSKMAS
jgi:hypothetical protein